MKELLGDEYVLENQGNETTNANGKNQMFSPKCSNL
jgi:hypothetical protein